MTSSCIVTATTVAELFLAQVSGSRLQDLGNYDTCLTLGMEHCMLWVEQVGTFAPIGTCVPKGCTAADIMNPDSDVYKYIVFPQNPVFLSPQQSSTVRSWYAVCGDNAVAANAGSVASIVITCLVGFLVLAATLLQYHRSKRGPTADAKDKSDSLTGLAQKVSLTTTCKGLFSTRPGPFAALNGIRVLSNCLVILGHSFIFQSFVTGSDNYSTAVFKAIRTWSFQVIPSAEFSVDSFFFLSGFLACYFFLREMAKKLPHWPGSGVIQQSAAQSRSVSASKVIPGALVYYVIHRFLRLLPVLALAMAFFVWVAPLMGSGPFWNIWQGNITNCTSYWYNTLLFVNNFGQNGQSFQTLCMGWTWYLSNDMQFYLLLPIFALAYLRKPLLGWGLLALAFVTSLGIATAIVARNNLSFLEAPNAPVNAGDYTDLFYDKPWTRAGPYIVGVALAFVWFDHTKREQAAKAEAAAAAAADPSDETKPAVATRPSGFSFFPRTTFARVLLFVSLALIGLMFYLPTSANQSAPSGWSRGLGIAFTTYSRTIWAIGLAGMTYVCMIGDGGLIEAFLGHPWWDPLAKLTYSTYVWHCIVLEVLYGVRTQLFHYSKFELAQLYASTCVYAFSVGFISFVFIEQPFAVVEKLSLDKLLRKGTSGKGAKTAQKAPSAPAAVTTASGSDPRTEVVVDSDPAPPSIPGVLDIEHPGAGTRSAFSRKWAGNGGDNDLRKGLLSG